MCIRDRCEVHNKKAAFFWMLCVQPLPPEHPARLHGSESVLPDSPEPADRYFGFLLQSSDPDRNHTCLLYTSLQICRDGRLKVLETDGSESILSYEEVSLKI